ncbi:hypothetical protein Tco_0793459 [Tanacetum coccineum]
MRQYLAVRLRMAYSREGQQVFVNHAWRTLFGIRVPFVREFILEFLSAYMMSDTEMGLDVTDTLCSQLGVAWFGAYWNGSDRLIPDKGDLRRLCHRMIAYSISGSHLELLLIDLHKLRRLYICTRYGDTWAWVAQGPKRQQAAATGAHEADEAGQAAEEVSQEIPAPTQAHPPPLPAPQPHTMS